MSDKPPLPLKKAPMTSEKIHEIAKLAAEASKHLSGMTLYGDNQAPLPTPAEAAANVVDAYLAAVKKLSAAAEAEKPAA
jgi:hypothetical protein